MVKSQNEHEEKIDFEECVSTERNTSQASATRGRHGLHLVFAQGVVGLRTREVTCPTTILLHATYPLLLLAKPGRDTAADSYHGRLFSVKRTNNDWVTEFNGENGALLTGIPYLMVCCPFQG